MAYGKEFSPPGFQTLGDEECNPVSRLVRMFLDLTDVSSNIISPSHRVWHVG